MDGKETSTRGAWALHGVWLAVFAVDAALSGRGREHQLGSLALGLLFTILIVSELRSREGRD